MLLFTLKNAVLTSSQLDSLGMNCHDLHPYYELTPEMAFIYRGSVASNDTKSSYYKEASSYYKNHPLPPITDIFLEPIRQL